MITAEPRTRADLGQYFTPPQIASFLASLFDFSGDEVHLLDPGAGTGELTSAVLERLRASRPRPKRITATAVELDDRLWEDLGAALCRNVRACASAGIACATSVAREDFLQFALACVRNDFFAEPVTPFNAAILNPPYRKIRANSSERRQLRAAGLEATNLYAGFLYLAAKLLAPGGELVAIVPRSFANGPYFKAFREQFFAMMSLRRIHLFDSRTAAFRDDAVLQENIVMHAVKSPLQPDAVAVSSSHGVPRKDDPIQLVPYSSIFSPNDPQRFLHIPACAELGDARLPLSRLSSSLAELGLTVSTGRVVDFRARALLRDQPGVGTFPLIYPCHCRRGRVVWPITGGRKPNSLAAEADALGLLMPNETYVLTKRFTSKEERRRIVATVYDPASIPSDRVGIENHLNYFHADGRGLSPDIARGLAAYLNSTVVDQYFRQFNGHTQVNATDLRNMPYPSRKALTMLGKHVGDDLPAQEELDEVVAVHLL